MGIYGLSGTCSSEFSSQAKFSRWAVVITQSISHSHFQTTPTPHPPHPPPPHPPYQGVAVFYQMMWPLWEVNNAIKPCPAEPGYTLFCKQCRSRSVGFWRSQLIWICTVCHYVHEFIATIQIKQSDWLKIRSGRDILIYSAWQGLKIPWPID